MRTIAHRDLRNRSSEILREVQAGESYEITNHGQVVALLVPADRGSAYGGLRVRQPTRAGGPVVPTAQIPDRTKDVLDELRGDR